MKKLSVFAILILSVILFSCKNENLDSKLSEEEFSEKSAQIAINELALEGATTEIDYEVDFYANAELVLSQWKMMGKHWVSGISYDKNGLSASVERFYKTTNGLSR